MSDVDLRLQIQKVGLLTEQNAEGIAQLIKMNKLDVREMKEINRLSIERLDVTHKKEMTEIKEMLKESACTKAACRAMDQRLKSLESMRNIIAFIIGSSFVTALVGLVYKSQYVGQ